MASPLASQEAGGTSAEDQEKAELDTVRSTRHELESLRTGRDVEEVSNVWADPEDLEKEAVELRRMRRQIRCLFGGIISSIPESTNLSVDDLIGGQDATATFAVAAPAGAQPSRIPPRPTEHYSHPGAAGPISAAVAGIAEVGNLRDFAAMPPTASPRQARPRSGGTESLGSVTNSSVTTLGSPQREGDVEEQRRKVERRERRQQRSRHREQRSVDAPAALPRQMEKDNGAMPSKQWNWAEEVVKASLDPANQWEFPGADDGSNRRDGRRGQLQWEQPRQAPRGSRGNDVAHKARERAEEVMRFERDR